MNLVKGRYLVIPFQQRGRHPALIRGVPVEFPHRVEDRVIMRIENVFLELSVPGNVHLANPMVRPGAKVVPQKGEIAAKAR